MFHRSSQFCILYDVFREDGQPRAFRYKINPRPTVNVFLPKALDVATDKMRLRSSQFGAFFLGKLEKLPDKPEYGVRWEACPCM